MPAVWGATEAQKLDPPTREHNTVGLAGPPSGSEVA